MKKLIILILTLTLILGIFSSCNSKRYLTIDDETNKSPSEDTSTESTTGYIAESNETNQTENTETDDRLTDMTLETQPIEYPETYNYTIKKVDGKWYMDFDSYVTPGTYVHSEVQFATTSFEQLYTDIINDNFSENFKQALIDKYRTENGIPIINFDTLYEPVIPDDLEFGEYIVWEKETFRMDICKKDDKNWGGYIRPVSSEEFEKIQSQVFLGGGHIAKAEDKTVFFYHSYLYVRQDEGYFVFSFYGKSIPTTDEYLLQFGAKKFQMPEQ